MRTEDEYIKETMLEVCLVIDSDALPYVESILRSAYTQGRVDAIDQMLLNKDGFKSLADDERSAS